MRRLPTFVLLLALLAACHESSANGPDSTGEGVSAAADSSAALEAVRSAMLEEDIPKAVRLCKQRLAEDPDDLVIAEVLVDIYLKLGAGDLARERIEATLARNPDACKMYFYAGLLHGRKGRFAKADESFRQAEECGFQSPDLEFNLAVLDFNEGNNERSIERLRALSEQEPDRTNVRRELARGLLTKGTEASMQEAQEMLDRLSVEAPDDWRVWQLLGLHSEALGDLPAAQAYLTESLRTGLNKTEVEEDYRRVSRKMLDAGMTDLVPVKQKNTDLPPISAGTQERFDEARRKKAAAEGADVDADEPESGPPAPNEQ